MCAGVIGRTNQWSKTVIENERKSSDSRPARRQGTKISLKIPREKSLYTFTRMASPSVRKFVFSTAASATLDVRPGRRCAPSETSPAELSVTPKSTDSRSRPLSSFSPSPSPAAVSQKQTVCILFLKLSAFTYLPQAFK